MPTAFVRSAMPCGFGVVGILFHALSFHFHPLAHSPLSAPTPFALIQVVFLFPFLFICVFI